SQNTMDHPYITITSLYTNSIILLNDTSQSVGINTDNNYFNIFIHQKLIHLLPQPYSTDCTNYDISSIGKSNCIINCLTKNNEICKIVNDATDSSLIHCQNPYKDNSFLHFLYTNLYNNCRLKCKENC